jgi:serine/threonine protein kinase
VGCLLVLAHSCLLTQPTQSDIESLRHRENGIGVRGAKNSGGQSVVHRASTTASRDKRHADLAANQRAKLDEWFKQPELDSVSSELKDFITQCFVADPERRADPTELFHHPYLSFVPPFIRLRCPFDIDVPHPSIT